VCQRILLQPGAIWSRDLIPEGGPRIDRKYTGVQVAPATCGGDDISATWEEEEHLRGPGTNAVRRHRIIKSTLPDRTTLILNFPVGGINVLNRPSYNLRILEDVRAEAPRRAFAPPYGGITEGSCNYAL